MTLKLVPLAAHVCNSVHVTVSSSWQHLPPYVIQVVLCKDAESPAGVKLNVVDIQPNSQVSHAC